MTDHGEKQDKDGGFRVVDRRRFDEEGKERDATSTAADDPPKVEAPQTSTETKAAEKPQLSFLSFVLSLATSAAAALGMLPKEQSHGMPESLTLAREYIDILAILQEKTRGNLSEQEAAAMTQILTDLRLQYVEKNR